MAQLLHNMSLRKICLTVFAVVFLSLIMLMNGLSILVEGSANEVSEELANYDPTDMSEYYAMGEYYPPDTIDDLSIDWHGGRVEIIAYDGDGYFVEEGATRQLREDERLAYSLDGASFSIFFTEDEETTINDAYKKVEIRVPREIANNLKSININTDGEVVLKNIIVDNLTVNGTKGEVRCENVYALDSSITTTDGDVAVKVASGVGYSVNFNSRKGKMNTYLDTEKNSYVCGNGEYKYKVKTNRGNLDISVI